MPKMKVEEMPKTM
jgi:hypothetical protein